MSDAMTCIDCAEVAALLDEYASGETAAGTGAAVDAHLRGCSRCRDALRELRALDACVGALPAPSVPDDLLARVRARLPAERPGFDRRATAPAAWFGDFDADATDERFLRLRRIAA